MIEAVMLWNEPNNLSHWDFELDRSGHCLRKWWQRRQSLSRRKPETHAGFSVDISPIDPMFIERNAEARVIEEVDAVAVHGFPLDWNHWSIHEWPDKLEEIRAVTDKPIWVSEVGVHPSAPRRSRSSAWRRTAELLLPHADHIHWYSLFDLPKSMAGHNPAP